MELSHLRYFALTAQLQHITKAAEQLYISQPALSKTISKLESELGIKVFDREGKNVYLNDYGEVVLAHAERIFSELDEMQREIEDMKSGNVGNLNIATVWSASNPTWLINSISIFIKEYPNVRIQYFKSMENLIIDQLMSREIDIALSSSPVESQYIEWIPLFSEKIGIILCPPHPLSRRKSVRMEDLRDEKFCVMDVHSDSYQLTIDFSERAHFTPNIFYAMDSPSLTGQVLERGDCVSIIAENGFRQSQQADRERGITDTKVFLPLTGEHSVRTCYLGVLNNRYRTKAQQDFIASLIETTKNM